MKIFEDVKKVSAGELKAAIAALKSRFNERQALCDELQGEAEAIVLNDGECPVEAPVVDGEKVLGVLSEDLRRFYLVRSALITEAEKECEKTHGQLLELAVSTPLRELEPKTKNLIEEHDKTHKRIDQVDDLFWGMVNDTFPELKSEDSGGAGIREGWKVVSMPQSRKRSSSRVIIGPPIMLPPGFDEVLAKMMGG